MSDGDEGDGGGMDGSGNGESVTVTSSPPSSGDGGGFQTSGNTMPTSPPGSSTQYITVHGHAVTVVNGVDYLTNNSGNGIATYQTSSGTFVPIKLSDIDQDIADDIKNVLRPFSRGR
ncbi:hypothetical protein [Gluconacetobacter sacchari]|uniref:Uncharacterized protein n=2 Tax=Gluconacetobacter sacchari TaxID=92759 RepID=A0A7W4ICM7_9PROT|nr:hypothetical protein [Gluconacetobacter sacchari]MBB2160385.1 hypothetical protein [Gluconacetobacter sacchari]